MARRNPAWHACLVIACIVGGTAVAAVQKPTPTASLEGARRSDVERFQARARTAIGQLQEGDSKAALATFDLVLADPLFATFSDEQRALMLWMSGFAAWRSDDPIDARRRFERATLEYGDNPDIWQALAAVEQQLGNRERASHHLARVLRRWPDRGPQLEIEIVHDLVLDTPVESEQRLELLRALFASGYTHRDRGPSGIWYHLVQALLSRGAVDEARSVARALQDPIVLVNMRADRRFDAIIDTLAALPRAEDAAAAEILRLRSLVARHPTRVDLAGDLGSALLVAGLDQEALQASGSALAMIAAADASTLEHADERVWVMNNRAVALRRLGRLDEAARQMEEARPLDEYGQPNVSQALNLGMLYCHLGRPADARRVIGELGPMSGYGLMVERSVRHCIAVLENDAPRARALVAEVYDHRADGEAVLLDVLMRSGDERGAAAELIRQLGSAESRDEALNYVQEFRMAPVLPGTRTGRATRAAVLQRNDVQAAIAAVGRAGAHAVHDHAGIE